MTICFTDGMPDVSFDADWIRTVLHVLSVSVWLGGQIVMLGLLPALRSLSDETAPRAGARAFGRVAWPAFGVAVATGIWNLLAIDLADATSAYNAVFGIKLMLVVISGGAAAVHQTTRTPALRGITGGVGFVAALVAFALGIAMAH